jgi:hypothetical protein
MSGDVSIAELAAVWLALERTAVQVSNEATAERRARHAAAAFDNAIRTASREDLLLSWEAARHAQGSKEMGSQTWLEARSVSDLLRAEYSASQTTD